MNILITIIGGMLLVGMWYGLSMMSVIIDVFRHQNQILERQNKLMEQDNDIQKSTLENKRLSGGYR
jgi:hypothetical protein